MNRLGRARMADDTTRKQPRRCDQMRKNGIPEANLRYEYFEFSEIVWKDAARERQRIEIRLRPQ